MRHPLRRCRYFGLCFLLAVAGTQLFAQAGGAIKVIKVESDHIESASSAGVLVNRTLYVSGLDGEIRTARFPKISRRKCASHWTMCKACCERQEWISAM